MKNITYSTPGNNYFRPNPIGGIYAQPAEYHLINSTDSMHPILNPDKDKIQELINLSEQKAAKWLKDLDTGDLWYWPASWVIHANVAAKLKIKHYDKGIMVDD